MKNAFLDMKNLKIEKLSGQKKNHVRQKISLQIRECKKIEKQKTLGTHKKSTSPNIAKNWEQKHRI
jgi:hypothetical protein